VASRIVLHAPVDVSGILDRLDDWSRVPPEHQVIAGEVGVAAARVVAALPAPFDVVVSCCLVTQLQLVLLQVLGETHPRFEDLRAVLGRIHVRTLAGLLGPRGVALLATDLTTNQTYPLDLLPPNANLAEVMSELLHAGNVIHAAHPGLLSAEIRRDPGLKAAFAVRFPIGPWLWRNGPEHTYLVYALEITARAG
jgi:hypothetical protein